MPVIAVIRIAEGWTAANILGGALLLVAVVWVAYRWMRAYLDG